MARPRGWWWASGGTATGAPTPTTPTAGGAAPPTQQPHFTELDRPAPPRLARVEPDDWAVARPAEGVDDVA